MSLSVTKERSEIQVARLSHHDASLTVRCSGTSPSRHHIGKSLWVPSAVVRHASTRNVTTFCGGSRCQEVCDRLAASAASQLTPFMFLPPLSDQARSSEIEAAEQYLKRLSSTRNFMLTRMHSCGLSFICCRPAPSLIKTCQEGTWREGSFHAVKVFHHT